MSAESRVAFGVWYDVRNPLRWRVSWDRLYAETFEQITWAEQLGFASVWVSEHHATEDGYLPAVFPFLAAVAARTTTLRLGTAVMLAPFQHPLRFAEDAAFVDQMSGGRLDLGLALGYRPREFELLGVPRSERGSRTEELVEVARQAWRGKHFTHRGRHWQFEDAVVTPPAHTPGGPPIFIGGSTVHAAKRAGRLGANFMPDANAPAEVHAAYRATLAEHGHDPTAFEVAINPNVYVCEDPERGWAVVGPHYLYQANTYEHWFAQAAGRAPALLSHPDELPRERYVVGTGPQVVAALRELHMRQPFDRVFTWARPPGLSLAASSRAVELLARDVMPHFQ